jgi:hypothetical protein
VNRSSALGKSRPAALYFDTFAYIPSKCRADSAHGDDALAGCDAPAKYFAALLDVHFYWERTWAKEGRMELRLPGVDKDSTDKEAAGAGFHATNSSTGVGANGMGGGTDGVGGGASGADVLATDGTLLQVGTK